MTLPIGPTDRQLAGELAAAAAATNGLRRALQRAARRIIALYIRYSGGMGRPIPDRYRRRFAEESARIIAAVQVGIQDDLWRVVKDALAAGREQAMTYIADQVRAQVETQIKDRASQAEGWIASAIATAQVRAQAMMWSAQALPNLGVLPQTEADVHKIVAAMYQALTLMDRDSRWLANAAYNQGAGEVAEAAEVGRMWIAERDACLHCLALSGQIAEAGQPYPSDLTFYIGPNGDYKPLAVWPVGPLWGPPRHPNCRCFQRPVPVLEDYPVMPWETGPVTPSEALKREARRSVLRGQSGSDSRPARLRAVSALLAVGADLPKSVTARARAALRAGQFRDYP